MLFQQNDMSRKNFNWEDVLKSFWFSVQVLHILAV